MIASYGEFCSLADVAARKAVHYQTLRRATSRGDLKAKFAASSSKSQSSPYVGLVSPQPNFIDPPQPIALSGQFGRVYDDSVNPSATRRSSANSTPRPFTKISTLGASSQVRGVHPPVCSVTTASCPRTVVGVAVGSAAICA